jgi:hypothetical protein
MPRVRNRHAAYVGGLAPGSSGEVSEEALTAWPWAFELLGDSTPSPPQAPRLKAREAREAIAASTDPDFIRSYVGDPRSSVHQRAVARLKRL